MPVYFCDPRQPWQRGSNENTNGLLRQYFPKGTDLAATAPTTSTAVAAELNGRPRKTLGWETPAERLVIYFSSNPVLRRPLEIAFPGGYSIPAHRVQIDNVRRGAHLGHSSGNVCGVQSVGDLVELVREQVTVQIERHRRRLVRDICCRIRLVRDASVGAAGCADPAGITRFRVGGWRACRPVGGGFRWGCGRRAGAG